MRVLKPPTPGDSAGTSRCLRVQPPHCRLLHAGRSHSGPRATLPHRICGVWDSRKSTRKGRPGHRIETAPSITTGTRSEQTCGNFSSGGTDFTHSRRCSAPHALPFHFVAPRKGREPFRRAHVLNRQGAPDVCVGLAQDVHTRSLHCRVRAGLSQECWGGGGWAQALCLLPKSRGMLRRASVDRGE